SLAPRPPATPPRSLHDALPIFLPPDRGDADDPPGGPQRLRSHRRARVHLFPSEARQVGVRRRRHGRRSGELEERPRGRGDEAMSPAARAFFEAAPYVAAFVIGALIPRRSSVLERLAVGIVGALSVLALKGLWPDGAAPVTEKADEWPHLLNVVVFMPFVGAIALLFLPRQSPKFLQRFTLTGLGL